MADAESSAGPYNIKNENGSDDGMEGADDEYLGSSELPASSVLAMAESVGVELTEEVAAALGELTMTKLRYLTLLAMQFSEHDNSTGLRVQDFSNAENMLHCPSYGHKSTLPVPATKSVGLAKISVLDEGPEIDLFHTVSSAKVSEMEVIDLDPTFFVHHAAFNDKITEDAENCYDQDLPSPDNSNFDLDEIPVLNLNQESDDENENEDEEVNEEIGENVECKEENLLEDQDYSMEVQNYSIENQPYSTEDQNYSTEAQNYTTEDQNFATEDPNYTTESQDYSMEDQHYTTDLCSTEDQNYSTEDTLLPNQENVLVLYNDVQTKSELSQDENQPGYQLRITSNCADSPDENPVDNFIVDEPFEGSVDDDEESGNDDDDEDEDDCDEKLRTELVDLVADLQSEGFSIIDENESLEEDFETEEVTLDSEWIDYLKVFVGCFLSKDESCLSEDDDEEEMEEEDENEDEEGEIDDEQAESEDEEVVEAETQENETEIEEGEAEGEGQIGEIEAGTESENKVLEGEDESPHGVGEESLQGEGEDEDRLECETENEDEDACESEEDYDSDDNNEFNEDGFQRILKDITRHGAYPILDVICDLFRDYIQGLFVPVTLTGFLRIVSVMNAFLSCPSSPTMPQMKKISSILIEVLILPPPCEVQQFLSQVLMKILKQYEELFTWTCTYITEVLNKINEIPVETQSEPYICILHGALCLANGLETLNIQVAHEFEWHKSILNYSILRQKQNQAFQSDTSPSSSDGHVEEQILIFFRNFLMNYKEVVDTSGSLLEMNKIHDSLKEVYGEKIIPVLCNEDSFYSSNKVMDKTKSDASPTNKEETQNKIPQKNSYNNNSFIVRKGYWKNRKVSIPYKPLTTL